jgi:phage baseplate assembly protein W
MRRHLGTSVPDAKDAPGAETVILQIFRSIAEALDKYVPWYALSEITLADAGRDGDYLFLLTGFYYPNAHKGDFGPGEERLARIVVTGEK